METYLGGAVRKVPHPCVQARSYASYLRDMHAGFYDADAVALTACAWLHNMHPGAANELTKPKFARILADVPLFLSHDAGRFRTLFEGRVLRGRYAPSRKLLEHTAAMVRGEPRYQLLDDQTVAYNAVLAMVRRASKDKREKAVVLVRGGPGTGKSIIALNLLGMLSQHEINAQHATGSIAIIENLWKILGPKSKAQIRYFNNFGQAGPNGIDVILADEAHQIRATSNHRFKKKHLNTERAQIDEIVDAAKVSVFFIDDHPGVRADEVGSTTLIRETAVRHDARFETIDLRMQFRFAKGNVTSLIAAGQNKLRGMSKEWSKAFEGRCSRRERTL